MLLPSFGFKTIKTWCKKLPTWFHWTLKRAWRKNRDGIMIFWIFKKWEKNVVSPPYLDKRHQTGSIWDVQKYVRLKVTAKQAQGFASLGFSTPNTKNVGKSFISQFFWTLIWKSFWKALDPISKDVGINPSELLKKGIPFQTDSNSISKEREFRLQGRIKFLSSIWGQGGTL